MPPKLRRLFGSKTRFATDPRARGLEAACMHMHDDQGECVELTSTIHTCFDITVILVIRQKAQVGR